MEEQKQQHVEIDLSREVAEGIYSNLAVISHSASEFIVDFASRIIMTPENAKRLLYALQDNIRKYENTNGEIRLRRGNDPVFPIDLGAGGQA